MRFASALRWLLVLVVVFAAGGCAGGSEGTGTGDGGSSREIRVQGTVVDDEGAPLEGVTVTILQTGDFDVTDALGTFEILSNPPPGPLDLEVRKDDASETITVSAPGESGTLQLEIKFNPLLDTIESDDISVNAKIVGACDQYFENDATIRQANKVPGGLTCTAKVQVKAGGQLIAHVPIAIQYRPCGSPDGWVTLTLGATMTGANLGTGQLAFPFRDDPGHCVYRIRTPFDVEGLRPVDIEIHTLTFQASREPGAPQF